MIGIGTWKVKVNTLMLKAEGTVEIIDNNGQYDFKFTLPDKFKDLKIRYFDIREEGNTLYGKGEASAFPGMILDVQATFEGDTMTGKVTLPFLGNMTVELKDGHRIA